LPAGATITITWTGNSAYTRVMAVSFNGIAEANAVDQSNTSALAGTGTAWVTGPVTTTASQTLLFGAAAIAGNRTSTPAAGWSEIHDVSGAAADEGTTTVFKTVSATGTFEASGTWSTAGGPRTGAVVAFRATGSLGPWRPSGRGSGSYAPAKHRIGKLLRRRSGL
jgi:hypothetical protein